MQNLRGIALKVMRLLLVVRCLAKAMRRSITRVELNSHNIYINSCDVIKKGVLRKTALHIICIQNASWTQIYWLCVGICGRVRFDLCPEFSPTKF